MRLRSLGDIMPVTRLARFIILLALAGCVTFILGHSACASDRVFAYYYPWYANPAFDGYWFHWNDAGFTPPDDITSNYYPSLGAYSVNDSAARSQHMAWAAQAGVGIIVSSWWGRTSFENAAAPGVLDAAAAQGLKVCFHLEPYGGRTAASTRDDIAYIYSTYGSHPAFLRVSRPTKWGPSGAARGVFFVFAPGDITDANWRTMLNGIRGTGNDAIVLASGGVDWIDRCHFDGIYLYAHQVGSDGSDLASLSEQVSALNSIFCAGVGPGFIHTRIGGTINKPRTPAGYDTMWRYAVDAAPEWLGITSFNEWHEGTQIEPAVPKTIPEFTYLSYEGHYGRYGADAETIYITRTRAWVDALEHDYIFEDVWPVYWAFRQIEAIYREGITGGCLVTPLLYCPEARVTRGQIAAFLTRAMGLAPLSPGAPTFADVAPEHPFYGCIEALYDAGITAGCYYDPGPPEVRRYCPTSTVTRGQMSVFLARATGLSPVYPGVPTFEDVPADHPTFGYIEAIYAAAVTSGCYYNAGPPEIRRYCPTTSVSRAQMAMFLTRAFSIPL
ncbi:MAG: S-layer homology domain-containing protein [Armatimonadota bacterium]|nr:MAG: S-layer homology domain-containing protein [Armatimonadota bacterium]